MFDKDADHSNRVIAGIVVHPSGFNVVLRDSPAIWIEVGMVHKAFGLLQRINGPKWGDPDEWADRDTTSYMGGYPIIDYRDSGDRSIWDRVNTPSVS